MEDYIFIIIAIVLSIFGAINRKKKKRIAMMDDGDNGVSQEPSFFEKQFNDPFFDEEGEAESEFAQAVSPKPQPIIVSKPDPYYENVVKMNDEKKANKGFEKEEKTEDETTLDSIMKDFSLKKAVIYSEILERKY